MIRFWFAFVFVAFFNIMLYLLGFLLAVWGVCYILQYMGII